MSMTFAMASEKQGLECFSYPLHLPALPPPPGLIARTLSDLPILLHAGMLHFAHASITHGLPYCTRMSAVCHMPSSCTVSPSIAQTLPWSSALNFASFYF